MRFDEVNLDENVLQGIEAMNFQEMTPVQEQTIPVILEDIVKSEKTRGKISSDALRPEPVKRQLTPYLYSAV